MNGLLERVYQKIRKKLIQERGNKCEICGISQKEKRLILHHKKHYYPDFRSLKDNDWEWALCLEFIDPELKHLSKKGYIRLIFFKDDYKPFHVYLDGHPQMNLKSKYVWFLMRLQGYF